MKYSYTTLDNEYMKLAYKLGKNLYMIKKWNLKTIPVAVLVKDGKYVAHGICSDGKHAIEGHCNRLETKGTAYDTCPHCRESEHAEQKALQDAYDKNVQGAVVYMYGMYKLCPTCTEALEARGITECVFLENAEVLFDRHHPDTVLGTNKQFN